MGVVSVRLEMQSEFHTQLKHRAIDEKKTLAGLLREIIVAGIRKLDEEAAAKQ